MNIKIDNYVFSAMGKTVTFTDYDTISLSRVVLITNVDDNIMVYNFAGASKGGMVSGNVLTLDYDTSSMSDTDKLQIIYDDKDASILLQLLHSVKLLFQVMANPPWVDKSANQMRAQVTGTVTISGNPSVAISNIGGYPAQQGIIDQNRSAWAVLVRGRLL